VGTQPDQFIPKTSKDCQIKLEQPNKVKLESCQLVLIEPYECELDEEVEEGCRITTSTDQQFQWPEE
jgi:hypothetical protein